MEGRREGVQQCVNEQHESESGPQLGQSWASRLLTGYNRAPQGPPTPWLPDMFASAFHSFYATHSRDGAQLQSEQTSAFKLFERQES